MSIIAAGIKNIAVVFLGLLAMVAFAAIDVTVGSAQTIGVDWKVYGSATIDGEEFCFYDAQGVVRESNGHIRVWTKCLSQKDLDGVNVEKDYGGAILHDTAQKVAQYYVPPMAVAEAINSDQAMAITTYEVTADIAAIQPTGRMLYELDCQDKMTRQLSLYVRVKGKEGFDEKPSEWQYVAPETNGARLVKILCPLE